MIGSSHQLNNVKHARSSKKGKDLDNRGLKCFNHAGLIKRKNVYINSYFLTFLQVGIYSISTLNIFVYFLYFIFSLIKQLTQFCSVVSYSNFAGYFLFLFLLLFTFIIYFYLFISLLFFVTNLLIYIINNYLSNNSKLALKLYLFYFIISVFHYCLFNYVFLQFFFITSLSTLVNL